MQRISKIALAFATLCLLWGCAQTPVPNPAPFVNLKPGNPEMLAEPYRIGVGDEVEIKFFFTPELNDRMQVRPDGNISLMFVQDIEAAGKTPKQLAAIIKHKLAPHIKHPDLVVVVRTFASQRVFVAGEVAKPGPVTLPGRETLLQVLDEAGWITPAAGHDTVVLVRRDDMGEERVYTLNAEKIMRGEDMQQNIIVQPGDLVLVPPSGSVAADRWVDQNIRQMLPFTSSIVVNRGVGPE